MAANQETRQQQRQANFALRGGPVMTPEQRAERGRKLRAAGRGTKSATLRGGGKPARG